VVVRRAEVITREAGDDGGRTAAAEAEYRAATEKPAAGEPPSLSPTLENFTFESFKSPDA
jgi:nucleoid-associated protein YgaU